MRQLHPAFDSIAASRDTFAALLAAAAALEADASAYLTMLHLERAMARAKEHA
jgi:hypothetical protein